MPNRQLTRSTSNRIIGGVAGGIAAYTGIDSGIVRLVATLLILFTGVGPGIVAYIILWIILPADTGGSTGLDQIIGAFKSGNQNSNPNPNDLR